MLCDRLVQIFSRLVRVFSYQILCILSSLLFVLYPSGRSASTCFTTDRSKSWKKVNDGKNCAFLDHIGKHSPHRLATQRCQDLARSIQHLARVIEK